MTLAHRLKARALALGFDAAGICLAQPSDHADYFRSWVEEGLAAQMAYLTRRVEERRDPRALLPGCRSILVVGLNSYVELASPVEPGHGLVARYAQRDDYHDVMRRRLHSLLDWLASETGLPSRQLGRAYVDTGPLLERELAVQAGLGWIGKNCCLIHPRFGSWLLLGELLLSIDLATDEPWVSPRCGTCSRCIDACPTGALIEPRRLDARHCIAYLTIELRDEIPMPLRPLMDQRIFGCDRCQDVCPWNRRFSQPSHDAAFAVRPELVSPSLPELLALDEAAFAARFRGSPILRSKRGGLLRNAAVAAGNSRSQGACAGLSEAASDPDPLLAEHARWALEQIQR